MYIGVTGAAVAQSLGARRLIWALFGLAGTPVLLWPLYNSIFLIPDFPRSLWPYTVAMWIFAGLLLLAVRPGLGFAKDGPIGPIPRRQGAEAARLESRQPVVNVKFAALQQNPKPARRNGWRSFG